MKKLIKLSIAGSLFTAAFFLSVMKAGYQEYNSSGASYSDQWTITLPSGCDIYSYAYAWGQLKPLPGGNGSIPTSASALAGIAGPPAGLIHQAQAISVGDIGGVTNEKWATTTDSGSFTVFHGGGHEPGFGSSVAKTTLTWL